MMCVCVYFFIHLSFKRYFLIDSFKAPLACLGMKSSLTCSKEVCSCIRHSRFHNVPLCKPYGEKSCCNNWEHFGCRSFLLLIIHSHDSKHNACVREEYHRQ